MFKIKRLRASRKFRGFALFETAISLIFTGSAITAYNSQLADKQVVNDVLNYSKSTQLAVTQYYQKNGVLPTSNTQAELPAANSVKHPFISTLKVGEFGEIIITLSGSKESLSDKTIILEPNINNNNLTWTCNNGSLEDRYRPVSCYKVDKTEEFIKHDKDSDILDFIDEGNYL